MKLRNDAVRRSKNVSANGKAPLFDTIRPILISVIATEKKLINEERKFRAEMGFGIGETFDTRKTRIAEGGIPIEYFSLLLVSVPITT